MFETNTKVAGLLSKKYEEGALVKCLVVYPDSCLKGGNVGLESSFIDEWKKK